MNLTLVTRNFACIITSVVTIFVAPAASAISLKDCQNWLTSVRIFSKPELPAERHGQELVRLGFKRFEKTNFYQKHNMTLEVIDGQAPRLWESFTRAPAKSIWSLARVQSQIYQGAFALKTVGKDRGHPVIEEWTASGSGGIGGTIEAVHDPADTTLQQQLLRAGFVAAQDSPNMLVVHTEKPVPVVALLAPNGKLHALLKPARSQPQTLMDGSAKLTGFRVIPSRYPGIIEDTSAVMVENDIFKFEMADDGSPIHQSQVQKVDYATLTNEFLGVKPFAPVTEGGFILGQTNSTTAVARIATLNGRTISELEAQMRPGVDSGDGFLGRSESLIEVLVNDNRFVVDESGLTHQQLAHELKRIRALYYRGLVSDGSEFTYHGRKFKLEIFSTKGFQMSPFNDGTASGTDFKLTNLANGKVLEGGWLVVDMIERYGFYEGTGTPYRSDPKQILQVLDYIKPSRG